MAKRDAKVLLMEAYKELAQAKGLDRVTVREISEKAGFTSQTFYNHFSDKYDLVLWRYRQRVDEVFEKYKNGEYNWEGAMREYLSGYRENAAFIMNAFKNMNGQDSYQKKSTEYLVKKMGESIMDRRGMSELSEDMRFYIDFYTTGIIQMICKWLAAGMKLDEKDLSRLIADCMPGPLASNSN